MSDLNFLDTSGNKQTITVPALNSMAFNTANTERIRIDPSGRLLIGTQSTSDNAFLVVKGNVTGSGQQGEMLLLNGASPIEQNYGLGQITFGGGTGDQISSKIQGFADHDWNTGGDSTDSPGRLVFYTTPDGSATPTEKLRISSSGAVTKPNHPSFRINRSVGNNYTSTTLNEILPWDVVEWDKTNVSGYGYDTSTYKYRVAVAGVYWFHCAVYTDTNAEVMFDIVKNSAGNYIQRAELRQSGGDDIGNNSIVHCAGLSQCAVGDYIFVVNSGGSNIELIGGNAEGYVDFSGYLIG